MGSEWLSVEEARGRQGLRIALVVGIPSPWGEAAKGIFHVKRIPFCKVIQTPGGRNESLVAWTGESNAPQVIFEQEPVRNRYSDIVLLAERISPDPRLVPADPTERATMFGLLHELCGENGFGWSRRLMLFDPMMKLAADHPGRKLVAPMATRYGWNEDAAAHAAERAAEIVGLFADRLVAQHERGSEYLVGSTLTALDIYWATFAALIEPLPPDLCPMSAGLRAAYGQGHPILDAAVDPSLLAHRDLIYERHLELPVDLGP